MTYCPIATNNETTNAGYNPDGERFEGSREPSWTFDLGSEIKSRPVFYNDTVYVSSYDGITAVNAITGSELWHMTPAGGVAVARPVVKGERVYAVSYDDFGRAEENVYTLDLETGDVIWSAEASRGAKSITVVDETLLIPNYGGKLRAHDLSDGEIKWSVDVGPGTITVSDGQVYISNLRDNRLTCLDLTDGSTVWKRDLTMDTEPVIWNDLLIIGKRKGNSIQVFDISSWETIWDKELYNDELHHAIHHAHSQVPSVYFAGISSIATDGNRLYVGTVGTLSALDMNTGEQVWRADWRNDLDEDTKYPHGLAVIQDRVYFGTSNSNLYGLRTEDGAVCYQGTYPAKPYPTIIEGAMYVSTSAGTIYGHRE